MWRQIYLNKKEIHAVNSAIDFIYHNIDWAEEKFYQDIEEEVIKHLRNIIKK